MKKNSLEKYLNPRTFWDTEFTKLDLEKDKYFIISRIAERGTDKEYFFIRTHYVKKDILYAVNNSRETSPKTKNFFNIIL